MKNNYNQPNIRIELVIRGTSLVPSDVTSILSLTPTRSFLKGDPSSSRNPERKRPWSLWALEFEGTEVQNTAMLLIEALQGKETSLKRIADLPGVEMSVAIWWDPPEGQGGFSLASSTLAQLCALGNEIHFYFPG
jgi:hypothetical protein